MNKRNFLKSLSLAPLVSLIPFNLFGKKADRVDFSKIKTIIKPVEYFEGGFDKIQFCYPKFSDYYDIVFEKSNKRHVIRIFFDKRISDEKHSKAVSLFLNKEILNLVYGFNISRLPIEDFNTLIPLNRQELPRPTVTLKFSYLA